MEDVNISEKFSGYGDAVCKWPLQQTDPRRNDDAFVRVWMGQLWAMVEIPRKKRWSLIMGSGELVRWGGGTYQH